MVSWMTEAEKNGLLKLLENRTGHAATGTGHAAADREEVLRAKMALEAIDAQMASALATQRAAAASETAAITSMRNAQYLLGAAIAAAISAAASLITTVIWVVAAH
jgi:hypothetical protein